jgi:poly [ADP-ribose] polymerase 2/3/4
MANIIEHRKFICVEFGATNNNKCWYYTIYDDDTAMIEWGRVGGHMTSKPTTPSDALAKMREKTKPNNKPDKLYTEVKAVSGSGVITDSTLSKNSFAKTELKQLAKKQIKFNSAIVEKLVEFLTEVNAHNIYEKTKGKIIYDTSSATFKTPLGIIVPEDVATARDLLFDLAKMVQKKKHSSSEFADNLKAYLRLIPHDVGMKKIDPYNILPDMTAIQKETDILDGLATSFDDVTNNKKKDTTDTTKDDSTEPKLFEVELRLIQDGKIIDNIVRLFDGTKNRMHSSYSCRVKDVYEVTIGSMNNNFDKNGKVVGNIMQLWHGTKCSNLLSIMKHGLIIPPSGSSYCTGRMFSDGLYFSDQSTKALNYAGGYAPGQSRSNGNTARIFMFLCSVAMGKMYTPRGTYEDLPKPGYDSTFAKADISGVRNNEMIVYKTSQANLKYLVEFKD